MMSTNCTRPEPPADGEPSVRAIDRILAYAALALAAASIISFFAIIIGTATGMDQKAFGEGVWPLLAGLPLFGLPLAFVLIVVLLVMSFVRKGRHGRRP